MPADSTLLRFAVYRPTLRGPIYLGDVLAVDRDAAVAQGIETYGGEVAAHRATAVTPASTQLLERAVQALAKRRRPVRNLTSR